MIANNGIVLKLISAFIIATLVFQQNIQAQKDCPREPKDIIKLYGDLPLADFDYRGQSSAAVLMQGDTVDYEIVLYAYKDYRVIIAAEPQLGNVKFNIYEKKKETVKKVKEIKKIEAEPVYLKDEYGEILYDDNWEPIIDSTVGQSVTYDTVYERNIIKKELLVFQNTQRNFWDLKKVTETKNFRIQVIVPYTENLPENVDIYDLSGCVNILVGHKPEAKNKTFQKY